MTKEKNVTHKHFKKVIEELNNYISKHSYVSKETGEPITIKRNSEPTITSQEKKDAIIKFKRYAKALFRKITEYLTQEIKTKTTIFKKERLINYLKQKQSQTIEDLDKYLQEYIESN